MNGYNIRRVEAADGVLLAALARQVAYRPESADGSQGYLVFQGTPAEYAERIAASPYSVVAEGPDGPGAYLLTSRQDAYGETHEGFVLVDQICVTPGAQGHGLAQQMLDRIRVETAARRVGALIMHGPVRNERSLRFFRTLNGFVLRDELPEKEFVWGYYEREY